MAKETIKTTGMHCHSCEMNIEDYVQDVTGVKKVKANQKGEVVEVEFDEHVTDIEKIKAAIKDAGYQPE